MNARLRVWLASLALVITLLAPAIAVLHSVRLVSAGAWTANNKALHSQFQCIQREIAKRVPAGTTVFIQVPGRPNDSFATLWRSRLPELSWPRLHVTAARKRASVVLAVVPGQQCDGASLVASAR